MHRDATTHPVRPRAFVLAFLCFTHEAASCHRALPAHVPNWAEPSLIGVRVAKFVAHDSPAAKQPVQKAFTETSAPHARRNFTIAWNRVQSREGSAVHAAAR